VPSGVGVSFLLVQQFGQLQPDEDLIWVAIDVPGQVPSCAGGIPAVEAVGREFQASGTAGTAGVSSGLIDAVPVARPTG
jgi:hypothetical protein